MYSGRGLVIGSGCDYWLVWHTLSCLRIGLGCGVVAFPCVLLVLMLWIFLTDVFLLGGFSVMGLRVCLCVVLGVCMVVVYYAVMTCGVWYVWFW